MKESYFGGLLVDNNMNIETLRDSIRVLSELSASIIWTVTFGAANSKAAIAESNWTSHLTWESCGDWLPYYNKADSEPVEQQLRQSFNWSEEQAVLFIKGPLDCILTDWGTFVRNWLTFVEYDDDGPFLVPINMEDVLRISPIGTFLKGVT